MLEMEHDTEEISRFKIIGDVYEIQEDGTLVHVPNRKVLSRLAYTHERYRIVQPKQRPTRLRSFELIVGLSLLTVTGFFLWLLLITDRLL